MHDAVIRYSTTERNIDEVTSTTERWNFADYIGDNTWIEAPLVLLDEIVDAQDDPTQMSLFVDVELTARLTCLEKCSQVEWE